MCVFVGVFLAVIVVVFEEREQQNGMKNVTAPSERKCVLSAGGRMKSERAECSASYQDREPGDVICYWVDVKFA